MLRDRSHNAVFSREGFNHLDLPSSALSLLKQYAYGIFSTIHCFANVTKRLMVCHIGAGYKPAPAQSVAGLALMGQGLTVVEYQMQNCLGYLLLDSMLIPCPIIS